MKAAAQRTRSTHNAQCGSAAVHFWIHFGIIIAIVHCIQRCEAINYCLTNIDASNDGYNTSHMQFTKEAITHEYAMVHQFKGLHCCAKGYRSIDWFKDGIHYPWSSNVASLIIYPKAENQTIYARKISLIDAGNYTCVLKNDTHKTEHHILLDVQQEKPDRPLATYPPHDQTVNVGDRSKFYCEAFIGDPHVDPGRVFWLKKTGSDEPTSITQDGTKMVTVYREDHQIIGSHLIIESVTAESYGEYYCRIHNGNEENVLEMHASLLGKPVEASKNISNNVAFLAVCALCFVLVVTVIFVGWACYIELHKRRHSACALA